MLFKMLPQALFFSFPLFSFIFFHQSISATDSFIYGGCSQLHFLPGTPYELNVNSVFSSLVNSASISNFNSFKISPSGSAQSNVVYGLFQCQGDLSNSICKDCVANSVSQLKTICPYATGGAIQLQGCFVRYDNTSFLGVQDKTVVLKRCGPSIGYNSDALNRRDSTLAYLTAGNGQFFRGSGSGSVQAVAQCVQDLDVNECQDCLLEASGRLRSECETSTWGDMFMGKCYIRYVDREHHSRNGAGDDEDVDKTLALTIGVITGVILLIVFLSSLGKIFNKKGGK
ncbi:cysteine-rich repeat secretory protein 12-like [Cynara cardunculus var. scolymus]|uniref:cysteine-rich repeat secretory protein 12-like n=1 Tax=Cynara cardunculus var. scolymus TaxID=59895 RepID=UPI000D62F531|nr:cysteine-rich repeat secretory protein 12-like [Cynara cardunculus var. scolymus]